jgi:peptide/nickel transport system permease protein
MALWRKGLGTYVLRRTLAAFVLLLVLSFGVFTLQYLAPGDVEQTLVGPRPATGEVRAAIREEYHLDEPFLAQYWRWLSDALRFDLGRSVRTGEPVLGTIGSRLGVSLFLAAYGFLLAMVGGVTLGVLSALRRHTLFDRGSVALSVVGASAPPFVTGILLLYVFAVVLGWFPTFGQGATPLERLWYLALPATALALTSMALILKLTRAAMIAALEQDYVAFARARGVSNTRVVLVYALRNAAVPIVTAGGLILSYMLTGTVLVEVTFALPGIGSLMIESVSFNDVTMIQGIALAFAVLVIAVNLTTDLLYLALDPRIEYGRTTR